MNRFAAARLALRGIRRHPKALARVAMGLEDGQGWNVGRTLAEVMDAPQRRRAAAGVLRDEQVVVRFSHEDLEWVIPSGDLILAEMLAVGAYESDEIAVLGEWLAPRRPQSTHPVAVEVGANVGTSTIPFCRLGYRVIACEPVSRIRALLEENLSTNGYRDLVEVLPYAIADRDGVTEIRIADAGGSEIVTGSIEAVVARHGAGYLSGRQAADDRVETVPTRSLTSALDEVGVAPAEVALVWSDTEGAETGVIEGGQGLWREGVPLWLEVWPAGLQEHGGIAAFVEAARTSFDGFVGRDALMSLGSAASPQPVSDLSRELHDLLTSSASWASTDMLLVPRPA